jgi:hypothetical protein
MTNQDCGSGSVLDPDSNVLWVDPVSESGYRFEEENVRYENEE